MSSHPKTLAGMQMVGNEVAVLVEDDGQLSINIASEEDRPGPTRPERGTVKAAVLNLLLSHPEGICRRDAALEIEVYELSNRIGELAADGWAIVREPRCRNHFHHQRFTLYRL